MNLVESVKRFIELYEARRHHDEESKRIRGQMRDLEQHIVEQMAADGVTQIKVDGTTVYQTTDVYVNKKTDVSHEELCNALRECGLGYMVGNSYSGSSLRAKVREWRSQGLDVPEPLLGLISVYDNVTLGLRRS